MGAEKLFLFELRHLAVGKVVPEIDSVDLDEKLMKLSAYRGEVVMLVFWATWCGTCMAMLTEKRPISRCWNQSGWLTVFVLDHRGVIRFKFSGKPDDTAPLDKLLADLVVAAEAESKEPKKQ
jgi:thiol-disulfide isomerase/thioredoxin